MEGTNVKVLFADDCELQRRAVVAHLEQRGHEALAAGDGEEAWEILQHSAVNLVISDWAMPRMDGLELCRKIRAADLGRYVDVILCTTRNTTADLITGMTAGADEFIGKPMDFAELDLRLRVIERVRNLEHELEDRNRKLSETNSQLLAAHARMENDLRVAASVQASLLPQPGCLLPGVRIEWLFMPCGVLAGDTFNYFPLDERRLAFYQLDVSGHGIPAAMLSVTLSRMLAPGYGSPVRRAKPSSGEPEVAPPHAVVADLNERFQSSGGRYFTMVYGVLDTATRRVCLSQAGHPSPIRLTTRGEAVPVGGGGFPVGIIAGMDYDSVELDLAAGERLVLYSDGVTECANGKGERLGEARLRALLESYARLDLTRTMGELKAALRSWRGGDDYEDDISLVVLESV
jgi:sigma-B regulation protein RsbU (phosphoserine phosphatase)